MGKDTCLLDISYESAVLNCSVSPNFPTPFFTHYYFSHPWFLTPYNLALWAMLSRLLNEGRYAEAREGQDESR